MVTSAGEGIIISGPCAKAWSADRDNINEKRNRFIVEEF
jgi:hypothetical protein